MGSLEDETESPVKDCQHRDGETGDGERLGGADALAGPELSPSNASQCSASQEDRQPEVQKVNVEDEEVKNSESAEDPALSVDSVVVVVDVSADDPASITCVVANNCPQTEPIPLEVPPDADPPSTDDPAMENKVTVSTWSATSSSYDPTDSETGNETRGGQSVDKALAVDQTTGEEKPEGGVGGGGVEIFASPPQSPPVPRSPAPPARQHICTQVSLEVVQCHSVACSPMTPPGSDHTFFFPAGAQTTNNGEMQTGHQVEVRSIGTAPMTPRTPITSTFPDIVKGESGQVEGEVRMGDGSLQQGQTDHEQQDLRSGATGVSEASESAPAMGEVSVEQHIKANALPKLPSSQLVSLQVTVDDHQPPCRPQTQRIGSMDQDITILVTQHDSMTESQDEEKEEEAEASVSAVAGPKVVKIEEDEDHRVSKADREAVEAGEEVGKDRLEGQVSTGNSHTEKKSDNECAPNKSIPNFQQSKMQLEGPSIIFREKDHPVQNKKSKSMIGEIKEEACLSENLAKEVTKEASSPRKPPVPSSPAPSGCQNMYTQVSLEVVQCQSAATSPMTPPEGENAFIFPLSCGRSPAMVPQVEYRSIATAPMTPNTPMAPIGFPSIMIEEREEEKILEVEKDKGKGNAMATLADVHEKGDSLEENKTVEEGSVDGTPGEEGRVDGMTAEEGRVNGTMAEEESAKNNCKEGGEGKSEEPVQEVSWDEKGMTWEVYGAVVEVAVLGSAIQKHLEKQVKKQKQPSLPPPPPLSPSAVPPPCPSAITTATDPTQVSSGKGRAGKRGERGGKEGRRRRNPFRLLLQNMQQPRCCSRAHSAE